MPIDIIAVDARSTDATVQVAERYLPDFTGESNLRVLRAPRRGISAPRNYGASIAKNSLLLFQDADVIVPPSALEVMVSLFLKRELVVASTRIVPPGRDFRAALLPIALAVSTPRFKKFGYWRVFVQWLVGISRRISGLDGKEGKHDYEFGSHD